MNLEQLTWQEVERLDKQEKVAMIPLGALEQHGHHLPLGTDFYIIRSLAQAVESELPNLIVLLPTIWFGHSPHHMQFAGTVSLHHQTYADLLVQTTSSLIACGFTKIVMLNGHGGNGLPIQMALQQLKNLHRDTQSLYIVAFQYWNLAAAGFQAIRESGFGGMGHACEMETSMMQHMHGDLVRTERIARDGNQPTLPRVSFDMLHGSSVQMVADFHEISQSGTFGDPRLATAEKGKLFYESAVNEIKQFVVELSAHN